MVAIIDLNLGNIGSWINIMDDLEIDFQVVSDSNHQVEDFEICVLPGVGVFNVAIEELDKRDLRRFINEFARHGKKIIGVCLGMQLLFNSSDEGYGNGLGLIKGKVKRFGGVKGNKLMRMEWGPVKFLDDNFNYSNPIKRFYFCHKYYCIPEDISNTIAVSFYDTEYSCMVNCENIYGIQFHPEKSGKEGIELLKKILLM